MKRNSYFITVFTLAIALCSTRVFALEFKTGQYFFDNSKLQFNNVKLVVASNTSTTCTIYEMTKLANKNWWQIELEKDVSNVGGYCFINSEAVAGDYNEELDDLLSSMSSLEMNFRHTKVRDTSGPEPANLTGWVFCPLNDDEISDGYWRPAQSYDINPSRTLPVVHINTQNSQTISSKDYYINGSFWLDNCALEQYAPLGTPDSPVPIEIKGRGNYTWDYMYKKPYKIKFAQKQSPLGLDRSRHFILLHNDDWSGRLRNETGFELSRLLGMPYTTCQLPVELVLNNEYMGLYFLCEKIRVENGRVEIMEQQDQDTNPDNATGGWLLEIGYDDKKPVVIEQFENDDLANNWFAFSSTSPESLSLVQKNYIHDFIHKADSCIFVADKTSTGWEQYLDLNTVARYYVIQEVTENVESFARSLIMYKDYGWDEKLKFGPVWDFDNSFYRDNDSCDHFIFDYDVPFSFLWIKELIKFPRFGQKIREVWKEFKDNNVLDKLMEHAMQWRATIEYAELYHDKPRWPFYSAAHNVNSPAQYLDKISRKVEWLDQQWSVVDGDVNLDGVVSGSDVTAIYNYILFGDNSFLDTSDVNHDGEITASDITFLYNIILKE